MRQLQVTCLLPLLLCHPVLLAQKQESYTNSIGMRMVRLEPGTFPMGSDEMRDQWMEQPVHEVRISEAFYISETEITVDQFRLFQTDFEDTKAYRPYAAGVSWQEARAFAEWLSQREGRTYRLPTEAEWEFVARAGSDNPLDQAKEIPGVANVLGVKNMLAGVREWVADWFGEYPDHPEVDPVGPSHGTVRVVRGGPLDLDDRGSVRAGYQRTGSSNILNVDFTRPQARLGIAPSFGEGKATPATSAARQAGSRAGLMGVWYDNPDFSSPQAVDEISRLNNSWTNDPRGGGDWSALWSGYLEAPRSGEVIFSVEAESEVRIDVSDETVARFDRREGGRGLKLKMNRGQKYPITVRFVRDRGDYFRVYWTWEADGRELIPEESLSHTEKEELAARLEAPAEDTPGYHAIGFRLVQGEIPGSGPKPYFAPFTQQGIKQSNPNVAQAPDPSRPYYRKRYLLPIPLENSSPEAIDAVALHPSFRRHNHSPGLAALSNGDVLAVFFTSYFEYEPGVSLMATRLRFGAEEWDMPSPIVDFVGVNDVSPLLWEDNGVLHLFWGSPKLAEGGYPFQWMSSTDFGATWGPVRFPRFFGPIGGHTRQPINSAFRDGKGTVYLASDGSGGESVLWASDNDGETWRDTGGRSAGRHTTFALLKDGRILGMGGKSTEIEGFMPQAISNDGGRSYSEAMKTPFTRLGSNQRPTLIRLASGRLFMAGDFVHHNTGAQPAGVNLLGSYVALSEDEGNTWRIKRLVGAQVHENPGVAERMKGPTLGYAAASQAPNGVIHLIATMNSPCLHFEFNEAWILNGPVNEQPDEELMRSTASSVSGLETHQEKYPDGTVRISWSGGVGNDGRFLLHGPEIWYYPDGSKQWEAEFRLGRRTGVETFWSREGRKLWSREYREDGAKVWTQWWPNGLRKAESWWVDFRAHGPARRWDPSGNPAGEWLFEEGIPVESRRD